jgi:hypothetical protein
MDAPALVIDHDQHVGPEPSRGRGEGKDGLEARAIAREQDDAAKPGLAGQRDDVVGNYRAVEADGERVPGSDGHTGDDQRPLNTAGRFSTKARMPSRASSVSEAMFCAKVSNSRAERRSTSRP